ncbi:hypothetical protein AGDE_09156 [Angomonas deanei]|nr:hypothetical protein AGDE_09156 [Angomonas deanei]|eukprot:EPY31233.1 hypothetical protein AGDE_09156 [Angomonas deanei]
MSSKQPGQHKPSSAPTSMRGTKRGKLGEERNATYSANRAAGSSHHIPPIPQTAFAKSATQHSEGPPVQQRSLISQKQRDELYISAFGFNTQPRPSKPNMSKLEKALHTTGSVDPIVTRSEKDSARFNLCVQALSEGCVQSYIHLFELSHREPVCVDVLSKTLFVIGDEKLKWLQQKLSLIEVLRRQSEFHEVFQLCQDLADYFEGERDLEEAVWHYQAALRYAQESLDKDLEQQTRYAFASFFERHHRYEEAADMYETMRSRAIAFGEEEMAKSIANDLARVYHYLGEQYMDTNPELAQQYFEKEAKSAKFSAAAGEESRAMDALGRVTERAGQLEKALGYHRSSRFLAHRDHQLEEEVNAALNAAGLEERLGYGEEAVKSLQDALDLAKQLGDPAKVCRATMQLGEVSRTRLQSIKRPSIEEEESAMMYQTKCFEEAFDAACASGQQDLIDAARIAMGSRRESTTCVARAVGRAISPSSDHDVEAQLEWMSKGKL